MCKLDVLGRWDREREQRHGGTGGDLLLVDVRREAP